MQVFHWFQPSYESLSHLSRSSMIVHQATQTDILGRTRAQMNMQKENSEMRKNVASLGIEVLAVLI